MLDLPKRQPRSAIAECIRLRRQDANTPANPRTAPANPTPTSGTGKTVAIRQLRHHKCNRKHRTHETLLACMYPRLGRIHGQGRFLVLAYCGTLTARRYPTVEEALGDSNMKGEACGSHCTNRHELVELIDPAMAFPWPT